MTSPVRQVGDFRFAARLEKRGGGQYRIVVAGRSSQTGHVVNTDLNHYPSRDQLNATVSDGEEVLATYLRDYALRLSMGGVEDDDD